MTGRFTRHPGVPLTDAGRDQARAAAEWIAATLRAPRRSSRARSPARGRRPTCSPSPSACRSGSRRTCASETTGRLAGEPYTTPRPGLRSGRLLAVAASRAERRWSRSSTRAGAALDRIAAAGPVDDVVVVSHGAVMLALWRHVTGTWAEPRVVPNAGVIVVEHQAGVVRGGPPRRADGGGATAWRR